MSEKPKSGPLGHFLGDLSAIRVKRNVSLEALREATKVYPNVISQFEEDGLKDHPLFNSLYVRAFIRSYANAVDLPVDEVLRAYDDALGGSYKRQLAIMHLDLPVDEVEALRAAQAEAEKDEPVFAAEKFQFEEKKQATQRTDRAVSSKRRPAKRSSQSSNREKPAVTFIPKEAQAPAQSQLSGIVEDVKESVSSLFEAGKKSPLVQWGLLAGGLGLGLFVILQLLSFQSPASEEDDFPAQTVTPAEVNEAPIAASEPDTVASLPAEALEVPQPSVPVVLGDSIPIFIVADSDKLDPFRLQRDRDLRRPYWLDQGDSLMFYIRDRVIIQEHLADMKILIEGMSYPILQTDSLARVVINRDSIQTFLASR